MAFSTSMYFHKALPTIFEAGTKLKIKLNSGFSDGGSIFTVTKNFILRT